MVRLLVDSSWKIGMLQPNKSLQRTFGPLPIFLPQQRAKPQRPLWSGYFTNVYFRFGLNVDIDAPF